MRTHSQSGSLLYIDSEIHAPSNSQILCFTEFKRFFSISWHMKKGFMGKIQQFVNHFSLEVTHIFMYIPLVRSSHFFLPRYKRAWKYSSWIGCCFSIKTLHYEWGLLDFDGQMLLLTYLPWLIINLYFYPDISSAFSRLLYLIAWMFPGPLTLSSWTYCLYLSFLHYSSLKHMDPHLHSCSLQKTKNLLWAHSYP